MKIIQNNKSPPGMTEKEYIDDAQSEIKVFAKMAAEQMYSRVMFDKGITKIISKLLENLKSETLKEKCKQILPRFALMIYLYNRQLVQAYAGWFTAALALTLGGKKGVSASEVKTGAGEISRQLIQTPYFRSLVLSISDSAYNRAVPLETWGKLYMERVTDLTDKIAMSEAKEDYSGNVNLRNIAEMTIRYEHNLDMISDLRDSGVKLVYIEPHANASKRCAKYQVGGWMHRSGLYSLDGTSGEIDGIQYRPLSYATDNPIDRYTTKAGKTYQNGCITGFNCRHRLIPYEKGNKPDVIPASVINRQREIESTQRSYERRIRLCKDYALQYKGQNDKKYKYYRLRATEINKEYIAYSKQNNVPFYRERTRIIENYREYVPKEYRKEKKVNA